MLVAAAAFAILVGLLAAAGRSWGAPVMAVAVLALGYYYTRTQGVASGLVALLIVTSTVDHYTFPVGSLALRPEQIAALLALAVLVVMRLRDGGASWLKPSLPELLLLMWFAVGVISSLLAAPDKRLSAKILALIAICSLGLFLPRRLLSGTGFDERVQVVTRWLLVVFATESAYGSVAYILHVFGPTIGLTPNPASGHLSAYGTLWEQNVFGGFAAAGAVAWVYLGPSRFRWAAIGLAACVGGLFDSLTRAAWLAAGLVGALGVAVPRLRSRIYFRQVLVGGLGGLAVVVATLAVDRIGIYNVRLAPGGVGRPEGFLTSILNLVDVAGRANQIGPVWTDLSGHLVMGRGIASYQALHVVAGIPQHVASLPLLVLNDTGVVGLALFAGFVFAVISRAWKMRANLTVLGLSQVALVIGLTNLATETTELMIGWLLVGIMLAACDVAARAPQTVSPSES